MSTEINYKGVVCGITAGIIMMGCGLAQASSVTVPNSFSAGSPAVAADVNANFGAVAAGVNDNDGRITTNAGDIATNASGISGNAASITTNASDIAALDARIAALEGSGTLTVASINGTYKIFTLDNGTGYHQQDDGNGIYKAPDDDVSTEFDSITFDGNGSFSGTVDQGAELAWAADQVGDRTYTLTDTTGITMSGTYSVSGSVVTLNFTSPSVFTATAYASPDANVVIMHEINADSGTGWEFYNTVIRVGVKLAQ